MMMFLIMKCFMIAVFLDFIVAKRFGCCMIVFGVTVSVVISFDQLDSRDDKTSDEKTY